MKFSRYDQPYVRYHAWRGICSEGTWRVAEPSVLDGLLPENLLSKTNHVFVMCSGSPYTSTFIANLHRVDAPAKTIDQEPYIVAFDHAASTASAGFVHHGEWQRRTTLPDQAFFDAIAASGTQAYYPLAEMPSSPSGHIDDLEVDSQTDAFWTALSALRNQEG